MTKYKYEPNNNKKRVSNEMYKVLTNLWDDNNKKGDYPPNDFKEILSKENPLFSGIQSNDSKDLINFLLERLHKENNDSQYNNKNADSLFNIDLSNETEILTLINQSFQIYFMVYVKSIINALDAIFLNIIFMHIVSLNFL